MTRIRKQSNRLMSYMTVQMKQIKQMIVWTKQMMMQIKKIKSIGDCKINYMLCRLHKYNKY